MSFVNPTVAEFKAYFVRDFPYGADMETTVIDADITRAIADADAGINQGLFGTQEVYTTNFLLLAAHNLVMNLRASSQGIAGQYSFLQTSKGVGSVNESLQIPDRILANPMLAMLCKTNYGAKYVMNIIGDLTGQVFAVCGGTQA